MLVSLFLTSILLARVQDGLPRGRCTFETEGAVVIIDALMACGEERQGFKVAERALDRHADLHGWTQVDGVDLVPPERIAPCPPRVLDLLGSVTIPCAYEQTVWVRRNLAQVFERNGRIEEALRILAGDLEEMLGGPPQVNRWGPYYPPEVSYLAQQAARIAFKHQLWSQALAYSEHWKSTSTCSLGASWEENVIQRFRADCLLQLDRLDELRKLCIEGVTRRFSVDFHLVEPWIELHLRGPRPISTELAVELLAEFLEPSRADELRAASRCWFARRLPPAERLRHLDEMDLEHAAPDVLPLLFRASSDEIVEVTAPLLDASVTAEDLELAWFLAQTGHPHVGVAIHGLFERDGKRFEHVRDRWRYVRERLDALSAP